MNLFFSLHGRFFYLPAGRQDADVPRSLGTSETRPEFCLNQRRARNREYTSSASLALRLGINLVSCGMRRLKIEVSLRRTNLSLTMYAHCLDSICFFELTFIFRQKCCLVRESRGFLAEGWLNCPNLEVPENFKVSCSDTATR